MSEESKEYPARKGWRAALASFSPLGVVAFFVIFAASISISPIGAALILIWARLARIPYSNLGFVRPKSWLGGLIVGILLGVGLKLVMKAAVLPVLGFDSVNERFHFIAGNPQAALGLAAYAIIAAGFGEETFARGYLFERIGAWLGRSWFGSAGALVLSTALFGSLHFMQGPGGVANATIVGFVLGAVYLLNRRRLWTLMVAHASFDLVSIAIIYLGLEEKIGSLIFHGT